MFIIIHFILPHLLLTLTVSSQLPCVRSCQDQCQIYTSTKCYQCLQVFYQYYDINTKSCKCFTGFQPSINTFYSACCPISCRSCGSYGCITCWENASPILNSKYIAIQCVCNQNYYFDEISRYCRCNSQKLPISYYFDSELRICYSCPVNCNCTEKGCVSCQSNYRKIVINKYGEYSCECLGDYVQINGLCSCPLQCVCDQTEIISCSLKSNRTKLYGQWKCTQNFIEKSGGCICPQISHFFRIHPDGYQLCDCPNHQPANVTKYFEDQGTNQCHFCPFQCECNSGFCSNCTDNNIVESIDGVCYCIKNYTMTLLLCQCEYPFYYSIQVVKGIAIQTCYCSSELSPTKYYYIKQSQQCLVCPSGCECSEKGCTKCQGNLLRQITLSSQTNKSSCRCIFNSYQTEQNICLCNYMYRYDQQTLSCVCDSLKLYFTFQDGDKQTCVKCPVGCLCDITGCYYCDQKVLRAVKLNSRGYRTCYCGVGMVVDQFGVCRCPHPYQYNELTGACDCSEPYYLNQSSFCVCKSITDPSKYYIDPRDSSCYPCPFNCHCTQLGCIQCSKDSLRFIFKSSSISPSICPCTSISFYSLQNQRCTLCSNTSYDYSGQCIPCTNCLTCDKRGCLSCIQSMYLQNTTCYCKNPIFINYAGLCTCQQKYYYNQAANSCVACPVQCDNCIFDASDQRVQCISCDVTKNRMNTPTESCRCIKDYIEMFPSTGYCCPPGCSSCDSTGCTSCNYYSLKVFVNGECICQEPMVQIDGLCNCPTNMYLFDKVCVLCPVQCATCYFNYTSLKAYCSSCAPGMNRNTSSANCSCSINYQQTFPVLSPFCIDVYCDQNKKQCSKCIAPMTVQQITGLCSCPLSTFISYQKRCLPCLIDQGCILCLSSTLCYYCNQPAHYYLSFYRCILQNVFYSIQVSNQHTITIQFQTPSEASEIVSIDLVMINPIYSVYSLLVAELEHPEIVHQYDIALDNSIVTITMNISRAFHDSILQINGYFKDYNDQQVYLDINVKTTFQLFDTPFNQHQKIFVESVGIMGLLASFTMHLLGYKYNFLFTIQTLSFESFKVNSTLLSNIYFGYYLRLSTYNFGGTTLQNKLFPQNYIEQSVGNYHFLTKDANILRSNGVSLILGAIGLIALAIIPALSIINMSLISTIARKRFFKYLTRGLEFFYKTMMYPNIFYSLQAVIHWDRKSLILDSLIPNCNILALIILGVYLAATIVQQLSILPSNMYKIFSLTEFLACITCSLSLIFLQQKYWVPILSFITITKEIVYIWSREKYLRDKFCKKIINYVAMLMEVGLIVVMIFEMRKEVMIVGVLMVIVIRGAVGYQIVVGSNVDSKVDKLKGSLNVDEQESIESAEVLKV